MNIRRPLLVLVPLALIAAGCGDGSDGASTEDDSSSGGRTIDVRMADNDFDPASIEVEQGETITFTFENTGEVDHDAFIGDAAAQADHEAEMDESSGMEHGAPDDSAITVAPGDTGELTYTFDEAGPLEVGCHEPGHYDAGMKIAVNVA